MAEEKLEGPELTLRQYKNIKDREKVMHFLLSLNDSYLPFRSQILPMEPMPLLGQIYQFTIQEESQQLALSENVKVGESILLAAHSSQQQ